MAGYRKRRRPFWERPELWLALALVTAAAALIFWGLAVAAAR